MATSEIDHSRVARSIQSAMRSYFVRRFLGEYDSAKAPLLLRIVAEHRLSDRNLRPNEIDAIQHCWRENRTGDSGSSARPEAGGYA
jgi:hypothetical protein